MLKNSLFISFLTWLAGAVKESYIFSLIERFIFFVSESYSKSLTKKILTGNGAIEDKYKDTSVFYKISSFVFSPFYKAAEKISSLFKESLIFNIFSKSAIVSFIFSVPFLCCVMFIVIHDSWNNLYALVLSGLAFFISLLSRPKDKRKLPPVWITLILFIGITAFCVVFSHDVSDSARIFMFFFTAFLLCLSVYYYICTKERLYTFLKWMLITASITAVYAIIQSILGIEPDPTLTDMSLNENMPGRAFSTLGNPNNYAEFLMLFMPFGVAFALSGKGKITKALSALGVIVLIVALLLTYSRSGWIAFAVATVVFVSMYNKKYIPYLVLFVLVLIPFLPESITRRILTIGNLQDTSSAYRLVIWQGTLLMLSDYWFTGVGLGNGAFKAVYPKYSLMAATVAPHSHMQFLELFAELGILGIIIYLSMTFVLIKRSFIAGKTKNALVSSSAIAAASAMTAFLFIGFFEYCWFYPRVIFAFFICAGVAMSSFVLSKEE